MIALSSARIALACSVVLWRVDTFKRLFTCTHQLGKDGKHSHAHFNRIPSRFDDCFFLVYDDMIGKIHHWSEHLQFEVSKGIDTYTNVQQSSFNAAYFDALVTNLWCHFWLKRERVKPWRHEFPDRIFPMTPYSTSSGPSSNTSGKPMPGILMTVTR